MSLVAHHGLNASLATGGWGRAFTIATRFVFVLVGIAIAVQTLIVVEARPQDLITGVHGMADLIRRAMPPDFSKLPAAVWPTLTSRCSAPLSESLLRSPSRCLPRQI
jgi:hypothetical protein